MKKVLSSFPYITSLFLWLANSSSAQCTDPNPATSLNVTTIAADSATRASILQCWSFANLESSTTSGTNGALALFFGPASNATYTVIPPRFDGGVHNAPSAQLVWFTSGLAHVTLPNVTAGPTTEAWIHGGKYGLIVAVDTPDVSTFGHITTYPSEADTVGLQVPFAAGHVPKHKVLYDGPCQWKDMVGI